MVAPAEVNDVPLGELSREALEVGVKFQLLTPSQKARVLAEMREVEPIEKPPADEEIEFDALCAELTWLNSIGTLGPGASEILIDSIDEIPAHLERAKAIAGLIRTSCIYSGADDSEYMGPAAAEIERLVGEALHWHEASQKARDLQDDDS